MPSINVGAPVPSINVSAPVPSNNVSAPPGFSTYSGVSAPITSFNAGTSSNVGAPPPGMNIYAQPYTAASAYPMYQPQTIVPTSQSSSSMVHDLAAVLTLPQPQMPKFSGDYTDYNSFSIAFDSRIASRISSNIDKLYYLNQYLEGEPKNLIGGCLLMSVENGYDAARALLKKEYGDPYKVSNAYLNKVLKWAVMKHDNVSALKQFSIFLTRCMYAMSSSAHMHVLNHAPNMQIIVQKLPSYLQNKWCDKASYFRTEQHRMPQFADLTLFIEKAVDVATDPIFGRAALYEKGETQKHRTSTTPNKKKHIFAGATGANTVNDRTVRTDVNTKINRPSQQCALCRKPHDLDSCTDFLKKDLAARRQFLMDGRMCFGCYGYNHRSKGCMRKRICATCSRRHPTALHDEKFQFPAKTNNTSVAATGIDVTNCSATSTNSSVIMHAIIPVNVQKKGDNTSLTTYAFYDNGSNSCFISEELVDDLQLTGQSSRLKLKTMHGQSYIDTSSITDLVVADLSNNNSISLPKTFSRKEIPVDHDQIPRPETLARCPHLLPISNLIPPYQPDLKIGLLIGNNCAPAMEPLEVIPSTGNGPFAVRLRHGWTIHGPLRVDVDDRSGNVSCGRVSLQPTTHTDETVSPNALLKVFEADFIEHQKPNHPDERGPSPDDIQFIRKAENIQQAPDGHFTLSMPFRDNVIMPNNRAQAVQRAEWQRKKLLRNEKYYRDYVTFMNTIIIKGYAEKVPADRTATTVWYLPHHGIYHPKKPEKIRVVFDASAKYHNISLNDMLIQGPVLFLLVGRICRVYRLDPIMDHNLLRVGGRLDKSDLPEGTKHPILLPRKSHITILIIRDVHERLAHSGRNHTMAQIRTKFWIIGLNSAVRQYICRCVGCRRERKPVNEQKMADLPVDRMTPAPPFTYTGVDFFGPILIKEGRKEMKRYGALYTCLVSRAVHIEIAVSLETDSFLNSLRRFIARRGPIKELRCDNGTNFVGAERELRQAVLEMNNDHLREQLLKESITWKFNPPSC